MSTVPAEISAYFSRIAKQAAQELPADYRHLRARVAAEVRWARARAQAKIDAAAERLRQQNPHLTHAQAVSEALQRDPALYAEHSAAHSRVGTVAHDDIQADACEIDQICTIAGRPDLAAIFVQQGVPAKAVLQYFLDQKKETTECSSAGKASTPKSPVSTGAVATSRPNSGTLKPNSTPITPKRRLRVVMPW